MDTKTKTGLDTLKGDEDVMVLPAIDKNARRVLWCPKPDLMSKDRFNDGFGSIEGYAAVWDNIDLQGEIIRKGSFAKSITEMVPSGKVKMMVVHLCDGGSVPEVIGTVVEAREDDFGLWFRGKLSGTELAQHTRKLIKEGHVDGASVGYRPVLWNVLPIKGKDVIEHTEMKFFEVTITPIPANLKAIISAKSQRPNEETQQTPSVDELLADADSYISSLPPDDSGRIAAEKDRLGLLCKSLGDMQGRVNDLLKEPQEPEVKITDDHLHSIGLEIERARLDHEKSVLASA